jgi:hypothetical protein
MKVVKHVMGMFDVFLGEGWDHHARVQMGRSFKDGKPFCKQVGGDTTLSVPALRMLGKEINVKTHYQTIGA